MDGDAAPKKQGIFGGSAAASVTFDESHFSENAVAWDSRQHDDIPAHYVRSVPVHMYVSTYNVVAFISENWFA